MKIEKIFYINLDERQDRDAFMRSYLENLGMSIERFSAVRPTICDLVPESGKYHSYFARASNRFQYYAREPELQRRAVGVFGAYISHMKVHENAVSEGLECYAILEDDCLLSPDTLDRVSIDLETGQIGADWHIIRSCWNSTDEVEKFKGSHKESRHSRPGSSHDIFGGAHFSIFNGTRATEFIEYFNTDTLIAIDAAMSTDILNVYHASYGVSIADLGTDIPKLKKAIPKLKKVSNLRRLARRVRVSAIGW